MILGVGAARFILTVAGVEDQLTRLSSMTAVILAGIVWFGSLHTSWKQRLRISYALILPYMIVEVLGLGYTWISGKQTIFHADPYSMDTSIELHLAGHAAFGLTLEPLNVFLLMSVLTWLFGLSRRS